jgi:hypothetical protein
MNELNAKIAKNPPAKISDTSLVIESPIIPKNSNEYN